MCSTAIMTGTFPLEAPNMPGVTPPTNVSSTSTMPDSRSRSGRTIARRSLCSHAHAVSYEANPRTRCRPRADIPFFCEVTNQIAANHVDNGVRVRWKIVPAVTDVLRWHWRHIHSPVPVRQNSPHSHAGQTNPCGQRSLAR